MDKEKINPYQAIGQLTACANMALEAAEKLLNELGRENPNTYIVKMESGSLARIRTLVQEVEGNIEYGYIQAKGVGNEEG